MSYRYVFLMYCSVLCTFGPLEPNSFIENQGEIAKAYISMGQLDVACRMYEELLREKSTQQQRQILTYNIATVCLMKGDLNSALRYFAQIHTQENIIVPIAYRGMYNKGVCVLRKAQQLLYKTKMHSLKDISNGNNTLLPDLQAISLLLEQVLEEIHIMEDKLSQTEKTLKVSRNVVPLIHILEEKVALAKEKVDFTLKAIDFEDTDVDKRLTILIGYLDQATQNCLTGAFTFKKEKPCVGLVLDSVKTKILDILPNKELLESFLSYERLDKFSGILSARYLYDTSFWNNLVLSKDWEEAAFELAQITLSLKIALGNIEKRSPLDVECEELLRWSQQYSKESFPFLSHFYKRMYLFIRDSLFQCLLDSSSLVKEDFSSVVSHKMKAWVVSQERKKGNTQNLEKDALSFILSSWLSDQKENALLYLAMALCIDPRVIYARDYGRFIDAFCQNDSIEKKVFLLTSCLQFLDQRLDFYIEHSFSSSKDASFNQLVSKAHVLRESIQKTLKLLSALPDSSSMQDWETVRCSCSTLLEKGWLVWNPLELAHFKCDLCIALCAQFRSAQKKFDISEIASCLEKIVRGFLMSFESDSSSTREIYKNMGHAADLFHYFSCNSSVESDQEGMMQVIEGLLAFEHWKWFEYPSAHIKPRIELALLVQNSAYHLTQWDVPSDKTASSSKCLEDHYWMLVMQQAVSTVVQTCSTMPSIKKEVQEVLDKVTYLSDAALALMFSQVKRAESLRMQEKIIDLLKKALSVPMVHPDGAQNKKASAESVGSSIKKVPEDNDRPRMKIRQEDAMKLIQQMEKEDRAFFQKQQPMKEGDPQW